MWASPRTLEGYALGRRLLTQEYITNGEMEKAIENILMRTDVDYIQVNHDRRLLHVSHRAHALGW